jgi:signal peptidase II
MSRPALRHSWAESGVLLVTAAAVYLLDRVTKAWIAANVAEGDQIRVIGDLLQVWHVTNTGGAFGMLAGAGVLLVAVAIATILVIGWVHLTGRIRGMPAAVLLGLVAGGTLGNLVDRVTSGEVVDFISVGIGSLRWPAFNVADSALFCGIVGLLLLLTVADRRAATRTA